MGRSSSLFFKLPLKLFFYTGVIGFFVFGIINYLLDVEYEKNIDSRANELAVALDWSVESLIEQGDKNTLKKLVKKVQSNPFIEKIRIYDNEYEIFYSENESEIGKKLEKNIVAQLSSKEDHKYINRNFENDIYEVFYPVFTKTIAKKLENEKYGTLYLEFNLEKERALYSKMKYSIVTSMLLLLLILLSVTMSVVKYHVLTPLNKVKRGLKKVSKGNYSNKIKHKGDKEINEIISFFNDMCDKLNDSSEVLKSNVDKAKYLAKAKSSFLANMTHELRTPLNSIIGYTNLLLEDEKEHSKKSKLKTIYSAGEHLLILINDILDFSKIEASKLKLSREVFSFNSMLKNVEDMFHMETLKKDIEFIVYLKNDIPEYLLGDEARLKQVIINLLSNAFKFTEAGRIELSVSYFDGSLIIEVADSGIGIPESKLNQIFDAFQQVDMNASKKYEGTGLGLSITKGICEVMNGEINVTSELNKGTTFIVSLKIPAVKNISTKNIEKPQTNLTTVRQGDFNILLAEDVEDNRILVKHMLKNMSVNIDCAENGKIALEKMNQKKYDLLLLDIQMPEMNGIQVLRNLKKSNEINKITVIALTAYAMKEEKEKIMKAGCHHILTKPLKKNDLIKKVSEILERTKEE